MPRRTDLHKILMIGAGPVTIGQGAEYDYAVLQVARLLRSQGYQVVTADSNPASAAAEPAESDRTYLEPLNFDNLEQIIVREQPDAVLPVFGGQTALNLGLRLAEAGVLERYRVQWLGPEPAGLRQAEDRVQLKETLERIGCPVSRSGKAATLGEGMELGKELGFPVAVKGLAALEGAGVFLAYNREELEDQLERAFKLSPAGRVVVEESLLGWQEIEIELLRDGAGVSKVVATIENIDPVGVHTGDSLAVLPVQSLSETAVNGLKEASAKVAEALGLVGAVNLQWAVHPENGRQRLIEINPRFTPSAALASRFAGLPLAALAARILLGESLAEIGLGGEPPERRAYVGVKLPRFDPERFPDADPTLGASMKAVGAVLAFGANFKEALQKGIRSLDTGRYGLGSDGRDEDETGLAAPELRKRVVNPGPDRLFYLRQALKQGWTVAELQRLTRLSSWFLKELADLAGMEKELTTYALYNLPAAVMLKAKQWGFSDYQLGHLLRASEAEIRQARVKLKVLPGFGSTGAENCHEPVWFSTYGPLTEARPVAASGGILLIGPGPGRIACGAEADYCLLQAAEAFAADGRPVRVVHCNPGSTLSAAHGNYRLFMEPLHLEEMANIIEFEAPDGVVAQFGGKTALRLAEWLESSGVKVIGAVPEALRREVGGQWLESSGVKLPGSGSAGDPGAALELARAIGYPVLLGSGEAGTVIVHQPDELQHRLENSAGPAFPVTITKLIDGAIGVDLECLSDGQTVAVAGIMERIEEAGIHSGDSALSFPPYTLPEEMLERIREAAAALARPARLVGMFHLKLAVKRDQLYLIAAEPGPGLTVPFLTKATGVRWVDAAVRLLNGFAWEELNLSCGKPQYTSVKEAVLPFDRFPGVDPVLGPVMRSTGSVIGIANDFGLAFIKAQLAAGQNLPERGAVFMSIREEDRRTFITIAKQLAGLGFKIMATEETAAAFNRNDLICESVFGIGEGRPNVLDKLKNGEIQWIISIPAGSRSSREESLIRRTAALREVPMITTAAAALAAGLGLERHRQAGGVVKALQDFQRG
jgi:carbamoyl-phosphate synthase large subunit